MCKIGDIILVPKYIGDDNKIIHNHFFVVVNDENGKIEGLKFDIVGTVMSSFKNEANKEKKLKYEENIEITEEELNFSNHKARDGYVKADQLYYFDKSKICYYVIGQVDGDVLIRILEKIEYLDTKNKLKQNIENIRETSNSNA